MEIAERIPGSYVFVDGNGVGDIGPVVLRDRETLAENGFLLALVRLDGETGKPIARPEIISRGFIYLRDSAELIAQAKAVVPHALPAKKPVEAIRKALTDFVDKETGRQPMILPVIVDDKN